MDDPSRPAPDALIRPEPCARRERHRREKEPEADDDHVRTDPTRLGPAGEQPGARLAIRIDSTAILGL
jgi:hypothetical protein